MKASLTPWLFAALLVTSVGCAGGDDDPAAPQPADNNAANNAAECVRDLDCDGEQICNEGSCVDAQCTRDADCNPGESCNVNSGECITPECVRSTDCESGEYCDQADGMCKAGCAGPADCGANEICNPNTNACESNNECEANNDCDGEREICEANKCITVNCVVDGHCDEGESCDTNTNNCRPLEGYCTADANCAADEKCDLESNACVEVAGCSDDTCPNGTSCNEESGECWECASDDDCGEEAECNLTDHTCEDLEDRCNSDADCANNQTCNRITGECEDVELCQPDSFEENNNADTASVVAPGSFNGLSICAGDEDFFAIQAGAGDNLEINVLFTDADGNLDIELIDPNQNRFGVGRSNSDNERIFAENLPLSGTYLLKVNGFEGAENSYNLDISLEVNQDNTCADDSFEENDAASSAASIAPQTFEDLVVCPGDPDFFKIRAERGERIAVTATFTQADGDLDLTIIAPDGETVLARGLTDTDNEDAQTPMLEVSGDYIIAVAGVDPAAGNTYDLTVTKEDAPVVNNCEDDNFEDNDSRDQTTTLAPGLIDSLVVCPGDEDWYAVGLNAGDDISVEIDFTHADGDLDLVLYQPENPEPIAASRTRTDGEVVGFTDVPVSGVYLVRVVGGTPEDGNDYVMLLERTEPVNEGCEDDDLEDNDNNTQPRLIQEGTTSGQVCSGDEDWFSIHANAGAEVSMLLQPSGGNLDLEFFSPNGQSLGVSSNETGSEELELTAATSGHYLIRVFGPRGSEASYNLTALVGNGACTTDDGEEENDSLQYAQLVDFGDVENLHVCSRDEDWYAVELGAGDGLTATLFFDDAQGDLDMQIRDESNRVLATATSITNNEEATVGSVEEPGLYYVRVYGYANSSGDYQLNLEQISGGTSCEDDSQEPNDSRERAVPLSSNNLRNLRICPNDDDWYALEVEAQEVIDVEATFTHADGDIDIAVVDPNGATLRSGTSTNDNESLVVRATTSGTHYVRVYGFRDATNSYTLEAEVLDANTCLDDRFEENDSADAAARITPGNYDVAMCKPDDIEEEDWYELNLNAGQVITATIVFDHDTADLELILFNADGDELDESTTRRDSETVTFVAPTTGVYRLQVYASFFLGIFDGEANAEYRMVINVD